MNGTESTTCLYLDTAWESSMFTAKTLAMLPATGIKFLSSTLNSINNVVLDTVYISLNSIEKQVHQFGTNVDDAITPSNKQNICKMIFECKAALEYLIPKDPSKETAMVKYLIPDSDIRKTVRDFVYYDGVFDDAYNYFERFWCKLSMTYIMDSLVNDLSMTLLASLYDLLNKLQNVYETLEKAKQDYMERIQPFLEFLDELDKFKNCAMSLCDYATTSKNYVDDQALKSNIQKSGDTWVFIGSDKINAIESRYEEYTSRINNNIKILQDWIAVNGEPDAVNKAELVKNNKASSYAKSYF